MYLKKIKEIRFARFLAIGSFNFMFDYLILRSLFLITDSQPKGGKTLVFFNTISATCAAIVSFYLNRKFVFRSNKEENPNKRLFLFLSVSLSGLYIINNLILYLVIHFLPGIGKFVHDLLPIKILSAVALQLLIAKGFATVGSLIWNYELYKKVVFKGVNSQSRSKK